MKAAVAAACLAGLSACTSAPPAPRASLYERLGGLPAMSAVVDDAVGNIAADPRINRRFASTQASHLQQNLLDLFCERAGGPCVYKGRDMASAHEGMFIRDDEFDALVEDIARSLDKNKVPARDKSELLTKLTQMRGAIVGH